MVTIEVKNDYMLGRQNENILYYKCMELEQENKKLKEDKKKAIEYIKNKPLYTETYDYNEEDNLELKYIDDEIAKNDLLRILEDKENEGK